MQSPPGRPRLPGRRINTITLRSPFMHWLFNAYKIDNKKDRDNPAIFDLYATLKIYSQYARHNSDNNNRDNTNNYYFSKTKFFRAFLGIFF